MLNLVLMALAYSYIPWYTRSAAVLFSLARTRRNVLVDILKAFCHFERIHTGNAILRRTGYRCSVVRIRCLWLAKHAQTYRTRAPRPLAPLQARRCEPELKVC